MGTYEFFVQEVDVVFGVRGVWKVVFGVRDGGGRVYSDFFRFCFVTGNVCCGLGVFCIDWGCKWFF